MGLQPLVSNSYAAVEHEPTPPRTLVRMSASPPPAPFSSTFLLRRHPHHRARRVRRHQPPLSWFSPQVGLRYRRPEQSALRRGKSTRLRNAERRWPSLEWARDGRSCERMNNWSAVGFRATTRMAAHFGLEWSLTSMATRQMAAHSGHLHWSTSRSAEARRQVQVLACHHLQVYLHHQARH